ncbi:MgtC/SapB family protein [Levilinea saccharolytica]|uniref:MgtC/SapB/SrpB/YhiD N-terminal domain-containing protein n=1 Tax=Levilinea saccharolytica TaxID=229921 RepID=A0A0P6XBM0_9CHLR|nr:MgtC/SapB family protein [Levilinea saccharolytica]KPL79593.1 hypothetical protein ADN01_13950 [Levilinea saccharolytica]GAP17391.1 uncharacterized membrane protein [Levilinea saccharolytica]
MVADIEIVLRLLAAAGLGALVGFERERQNQPAGLRTHIVVVMGASLAMSLSINLAMQFREFAPNGDPARLAAQVISGIGFLGAGAILRFGASVKGLTTAASLWTMAIVGLVVGAGYYIPALGATVTLLVVLSLLNVFETRFVRPRLVVALTLTVDYRPGIEQEIRAILTHFATGNEPFTISKHVRTKRIKIETVFKLKDGKQLDEVAEELSNVSGVRVIKTAP